MENNYMCFRCGYSYYNKSNVRDHLKRKKECSAILDNISREECIDII